jgi:outer membrane lipoprotein SlyB
MRQEGAVMKNTQIGMTILVTAFLTACAAPDVNRSALNFNENKFSIDLNLCRGGNIAEASLKTIGKGALGSLAGAGIVALHGAVAAGSGEAVVAGAIVGAVIGLGIGANDAIEEHQREIADCIREKGYEVVAATN